MWLYLCREVYDVLVRDGTIVPKPEKNPPTVPMDYSWAQVSEKNRLAQSFSVHSVSCLSTLLYRTRARLDEFEIVT